MKFGRGKKPRGRERFDGPDHDKWTVSNLLDISKDFLDPATPRTHMVHGRAAHFRA
jgi:hypothetical protein